MNFKRLFQRLTPPPKGGKETGSATRMRTVKLYFLEFANIADSPSYALEATLSVGSETGDIVIEDPSLSAHHAIFSLKDGMVTVQDLGSRLGTTVSGHALGKGKPVILQADDEILLGELQIFLRMVEEEIEDEDIHESVEEPSPPPIALTSPSEEDAEVVEMIHPEDKIKKRIADLRKNPKSNSSQKAIVGGSIPKAANMLTRAMGFIFDILCTIILWQIFSPFDEFRLLVATLPQFLQHEVLPHIEAFIGEQGYAPMYNQLMQDFLGGVGELEDQLQLSHIIGLFLYWRILSTLLFGVSVGAWMAGVRSYGNTLWKRAGGTIREILGWALWPTVIADLPTLFSKRSLQEMLSFTHLYSPNKSVVLVLWTFFLPLVLVGALVSPLFAGLEVPFAVPINEVTNKHKVDDGDEVRDLSAHSSKWFGARFNLPSDKWKILPRFSWAQDKGSVSLTPSLVFYHEDGTTLPLVLAQKFSWPKLLNLALAHNPPLQSAFPTLWAHAQSEKIRSGSFIKFNPNALELLKYQSELQLFIKAAFELSLESSGVHAVTYGPFFQGPISFRRELFQLIGANETGNWIFDQHGKSIVLIYETPGMKPVEMIIPLVFGPGRIFRVGYASNKEWNKARKTLRRDLWAQSSWQLPADEEVSGAPLVIDVIAQTAEDASINEEQVERVYGFFFEAAASVVTLSNDDQGKKSLMQAIKNLVEVVAKLERRKMKMLGEERLALLEKLRQKLIEVHGRLEVTDENFFASESTEPKEL